MITNEGMLLHLPSRTLEEADMKFLYHKYMEMSSLLDEYEKEVYSDWCSNVEQVCQLNLDQPLIRRDFISGFLSVNFNQEVQHIIIVDYLNKQTNK